MTKKQIKQHRKDRELACQMAASVMAGRPDEKLSPTLWSVTVFFESYLHRGAAGTKRNFGPKKAAILKLVKGQPS